MGSLSNLPPGCSSPDGGIDHEWEAATDKLLGKIETTEAAEYLTALAPQIESIVRMARMREKHETQIEIVELVERLFGPAASLKVLQELHPLTVPPDNCARCDNRGYFADDMMGNSFTPCPECKTYERCPDGIHVRKIV